MKSLFHFLIVLVVFVSSSAHADPSKRRQFLFNLGFTDISQVFRDRLAAGQFNNELTERHMKANVIAYEAVNAARELSILMLEEMGFDQTQLHSQKAQDLGVFAARLIGMKSAPPPLDVPSRLLTIEDEMAKKVAIADWLRANRTRSMNEHKVRLLSDIVHFTYGDHIGGDHFDGKEAQIRRMDKMLHTILERLYLNDTTGSNAYFGRALTALLLREEKLARDASKPMTKAISTELLTRFHRRLENYFGDVLMIDTPKGIERVQIQNGTLGLTRIPQASSLMISVAAIPKRESARWKGRFSGLIANPLSLLFFGNEEKWDGKISIWNRFRDWVSHGGLVSKGFSHIVYYEIMKDLETGIIMPRLIDNYPGHLADNTGRYIQTGGTRFGYPEQLVMAQHSAVYLANPDPVRLSDWARRFVKQNGYESSFFPSLEVELKDGEIPIKNDHVVSWKTSISRAEFDQLHSERNQVKHGKDMMKLFVKGLEESVYAGWTFHWPDPYDFYLIDATYCSQLAEMVMRKFVGVPMEEWKSTWHWGLRFLANVGKFGESLTHQKVTKGLGEEILALPGVAKAMKITNIQIISPTSIATQPFEEGKAYRLRIKSPEQRVNSDFSSGLYGEVNSALTDRLRMLNLSFLGDGSTNYSSDYARALAELGYIRVMRASVGLPKILDLEEEDFANLGSDLESARLGLKDNSCAGNLHKNITKGKDEANASQ